MVAALQRRHIDIRTRDIVHRRTGSLTQSQDITAIGNGPAVEQDDDACITCGDGNRMIGTGDFDGLIGHQASLFEGNRDDMGCNKALPKMRCPKRSQPKGDRGKPGQL
ncbi:hypothetical protein ASG68_19080 [Rhizobium sp. Leaf453]|nr:hypothetical protein ASG42_28895 [Rhizobium sp. Leaf391]KQS99055.1 hypothetical protein ASG50_20280 [Rhizobium sp. Leaf386]KQT91914.1 hypothetical protein ASG68_19080 [Rhizobium sp. Leaf453]